MSGNVLILSEDAVFARMLEIELMMRGWKPVVATAPIEGFDADAVLWDLDSIRFDTGMLSEMHIIGFTAHATVSALDPDRICSIILHRPFEMRMLREELELLLSDDGKQRIRGRSRGRFVLTGQTLTYRDKAVTLSPSEAEVMRLLLDAKSNPVSRANIAKAIGDSATNKADVYVCYLRRKLRMLTDRNHLITVRGVGYRFQE